MLELGETLEQGVVRELLEETGLQIRVLELIEVFERIVYPPDGESSGTNRRDRPRFHYVIADYLCERISGEHAAASDVTDTVFAPEEDLERFSLTATALRILHKAFAMDRARRGASKGS
jgi:ADP-ribose pyrophosphatase YjhB (NUDIX family)